MLLLYIPDRNSRIKFAAEVCFKHIYKTTYKITTDLVEFEKSDAPCFWYAKEKVSEKPGIVADKMMLDSSIIGSPGRSVFNDIITLFPTESNMLPPFDLFASVFWYVTRMEEYNYYSEDVDHRFFSKMSIGNKIDILNKPIVNIWIKLYVDELQKLYPDLTFDKPSFKYIPSIDVDSAFMFRHKGFIRNAGGLLKDIFKNNFKNVTKRIRVVSRREADPWFCFDKINELHKKYDLKPSYFFLVGKYSRLDKNISPRNKSMKKLIHNLSKDDYTIGLHPSYKGNKNRKSWKKELKILKNITNNDIFSSRQHYVFVSFPKTYQNLIKLGIKRDFSMLYPDLPGFRLGTTVPVPFFDLSTNERTDLWLYPTMIMDVSLLKYQKLTIENAIKECLGIINYTKEYGGTLITLWHNESLSEYGQWQGWNKVYEEILKAATED
ncbi:MAG: polysaccharide deacetylase family protein [Bacteroidales bacterium]|jgi:hypothetical protein|nr:polysaccharide deacetylase family protein [Bacteroidales bacterium]